MTFAPLSPVSTEKAPAAVGPYSQAMQAGPMVFVSGQLGLDPASGTFAADDLAGQARQAMMNMVAILAEAGCNVENIVSVDVFLTDMGAFKGFNTVYSEFMGTHKPARAAVEVSGLPLGGLVEVRCVAIRNE